MPGIHIYSDAAMDVRRLTSEGRDVPCVNRWDLFTADTRAARRMAELMCVGCPIFDECDADATRRGENFGVYAGRDRTPR